MRIAIAIHEYPPVGGGAATAARETARALAGLGHEVLVVTARAPGLPPEQRDGAVRIVRLPSLRFRTLAPNAVELLSFCASARFLLARVVGDFDADALLAYFAVPVGFFAVGAGRKLGIPVIVSLRGSDVPGFADGRLGGPLGRIAHPFIRKTLLAADRVAPNSAVLERLAAAFAPELEGEMAVVRNGVAPDFMAEAPARSEGDGVVVVTVGQLIRRKRIDMTITALSEIRARGVDARLVVAGEGPLRSELELQIESLGLGDCVSLRGRVGRADVPALLRAADIFAMPSAAEGMSNAVVEAMASGLPVVCARNGSHDVVEQAAAGSIVEQGDQRGFTDALAALCDDPTQRVELARRGLRWARGITWERCAREFIALFAEAGADTTPSAAPHAGDAPSSR